MKLKNILIILLCSVVVSSCKSEQAKDKKEDKTPDKVEQTKADSLVSAIEKAHGKSVFDKKELVQFDLNLFFGGKSRFEGTILMTPDGSLIKMQDSSTVMIWDGKKAFIVPDSADDAGARFALFTWSYFFAAPYKLSDEGTKHEYLGEQPLGDMTFLANKLTFKENVGDSPDDWYILYKDKNSDLLAAMAYIVTYGGTSKSEAEEDPHLITYEAYSEIEGIPFATQWNFWTWNKKGEMKKLLGNATISNIKFIKKADVSFETPANFKELNKQEV